MDAGPELLTAGRFGDQTLLSAKALRLYADNGLLPPDHVDPVSGYRYYRRDQVRTGWLIALLRSAEMSLADIAVVVHADPVAALASIAAHEAALDRRIEAHRFVLLRARQHLSQEDDVSENPAILSVVVPDEAVLSLLRQTYAGGLEETIHAALVQLRQVAGAAGLTESGDAYGIFHQPVTDDSDGPVEIVLPVDRLTEIDGLGDVRSYRLTGGRMATSELTAPETDFPAILGRYDEVAAWIDGSGHTRTGPPRETWHNSPRDLEPLHLTISWPYA